jgi:hypothetical protein
MIGCSGVIYRPLWNMNPFRIGNPAVNYRPAVVSTTDSTHAAQRRGVSHVRASPRRFIRGIAVGGRRQRCRRLGDERFYPRA